MVDYKRPENEQKQPTETDLFGMVQTERSMWALEDAAEAAGLPLAEYVAREVARDKAREE